MAAEKALCPKCGAEITLAIPFEQVECAACRTRLKVSYDTAEKPVITIDDRTRTASVQSRRAMLGRMKERLQEREEKLQPLLVTQAKDQKVAAQENMSGIVIAYALLAVVACSLLFGIVSLFGSSGQAGVAFLLAGLFFALPAYIFGRNAFWEPLQAKRRLEAQEKEIEQLRSDLSVLMQQIEEEKNSLVSLSPEALEEEEEPVELPLIDEASPAPMPDGTEQTATKPHAAEPESPSAIPTRAIALARLKQMTASEQNGTLLDSEDNPESSTDELPSLFTGEEKGEKGN
jgi:hypothetical protein